MRMMVMVIVAAVACGPSAAELRDAKLATYTGDPGSILQTAEQVAAESYRIGEEDRDAQTFATVPQWYRPDGGRESAGAGDYVQLDDRSVQLTLVVELVPADLEGVRVKVTPRALQYLAGSPKPRELAPDDPNLPPWVNGRVEALELAIHERLSQGKRAP